MNNRRRIFLAFRNVLKLRLSIIEMIFFSIGIGILLFTISFNNSLNEYWEQTKKTMDHRTFLVGYNPDEFTEEKAISKLSKYKNVEVVKPYSSYLISMKSNDYHNKEKLDGMILVGAIDNPVKISKGEDLSNYDNKDKVMICARQFYPYVEKNKADYNINNSIDIAKQIGENLSLSFITSNEIENFKLVGVYDIEDMNTIGNTCYTKWDTVTELNMKYEPEVYTNDGKTYNPIVVVINHIKNNEKFMEDISKDGFMSAGPVIMLNTSVGDDVSEKLLSISYVLCILIISILVIIKVYDIRKRKKEYGIMKVFGYYDNDISYIKVLEEIIKNSISLIFSIPIYILLTKVFEKSYINFSPIMSGFKLKLYNNDIIIIGIIIIIYSIVITTTSIKKIKKINIIDMMAE